MRIWQPIETAPRDGTEVLLFANKEHTDGGHIGIYTWIEELGQWLDHAVEYPIDSYGEPTHWMPLPLPPGEGPSVLPNLHVQVEREKKVAEELRKEIRGLERHIERLEQTLIPMTEGVEWLDQSHVDAAYNVLGFPNPAKDDSRDDSEENPFDEWLKKATRAGFIPDGLLGDGIKKLTRSAWDQAIIAEHKTLCRMAYECDLRHKREYDVSFEDSLEELLNKSYGRMRGWS